MDFWLLAPLAAESASVVDRMDAWVNAALANLGQTGEATVRLILAATFGGIIGLEREIRGHEAGFRTFMLVCAGAALAMIVSVSVPYGDWSGAAASQNVQVVTDPARIAYGVMTGVGFLGAGTIIRRRDGVEGLTTAAGIWSVAALGLSVGLGLYVISMMATVLLLVALLILGLLRRRLPTVHSRVIKVRVPFDVDCDDRMYKLALDQQLRVRSVRMKRPVGSQWAAIEMRVNFLRRSRWLQFKHRLLEMRDVEILGIR